MAYNNYDLYSILIPVYAFLFIAARIALSGDFTRFLERLAKIQCGLLVCVYCLSFAPALHIIAESVDETRTWEGALGGAAVTAVMGIALYWATPFAYWWQAGAMSLLIAVMASAGALTMAAIKRDRGEVTSGTFVEGHGGVLSRIDAVSFAAPVFYHVTRYFFGGEA